MLWGLFGKSKSDNGIISKATVDKQSVEVSESDYGYNFTSSSFSSLLGGEKGSRHRSEIYQKWTDMESNPLIGRALRIHVMGALSGDSVTGRAIKIRLKPDLKDQKKYIKLLDNMRHLEDIFNRIDSAVAYNAIAFGDAYGRIYAEKGRGVVAVNTDEMVRPSVVQPFEKMGQTVGYVVSTKDNNDSLTTLQMARCKMPRLTWTPQPSVVDKIYRSSIREDSIAAQPVLPAMAGGSILYNAEGSYDNFNRALIGMTAQRWQDSIDEQIVGIDMSHMTKDQQFLFKKSIKEIFLKSKMLAQEAVTKNKPVLSRVRHFLPVSGEKQVTQILGGTSQGRTPIDLEDVMFHAKTLGGNLGVDLSMLGFSDMLGGGLGDGGAFRNSIQMAELSGMVRSAITDFFFHIIDVHTYHADKMVFDRHNTPFEIEIVGSVSALEKEKEATRFDKMSSGSVVISTLQQMKDTGFDEKSAQVFLVSQMGMDEEEAKLYAKAVTAKTDEDML